MTENILNDILRELCSFEELKEESRLREDLGLDSLKMIYLLLMTEERFGIRLSTADMNPFDLTDVASVLRMIRKYRSDEDDRQS